MLEESGRVLPGDDDEVGDTGGDWGDFEGYGGGQAIALCEPGAENAGDFMEQLGIASMRIANSLGA